MSNKIKSYKVYTEDGELFMAIILSDQIELKTINKLLRNGMKVIAVDERSSVVNKELVDT